MRGTGESGRVELHGWISNYWEQGMEESPWHIFQDEAFVGDAPGSWRHEGMHRLQDGDHLTIFDSENRVLWSGRLKTRRVGLLKKLHAGSSEWFPTDIQAETWAGWFRASPPLRATLVSGDG